ncbi:hypothetical protein ACXIZN_04920 [Amycolatopsis sp. TRM77291]
MTCRTGDPAGRARVAAGVLNSEYAGYTTFLGGDLTATRCRR